ncbi:hypothetical protein D3C71_655600 [compost metagenome]
MIELKISNHYAINAILERDKGVVKYNYVGLYSQMWLLEPTMKISSNMNQKFIDRFHALEKIDQLDQNAKQNRGIQFENLMHDVFTNEGILLKKGFHTADNRSEQIDGAIEVWNRVLLVEVKWVEKNLAASDLFAFIGKIENKLQGTLGLFISRNELSENFISAIKSGRKKNIVVFHGEDVNQLFRPDSVSFTDYLEHCLKLFSYDNIAHYPYKYYMEELKGLEVLAESSKSSEVQFINDFLNNKDDVVFENMVDAYRDLSDRSRKGIFDYAFAYVRVIMTGAKSGRFSYSPYNYQKYFSMLDPGSAEIDGFEQRYFNEKLLQYPDIYGRVEIRKLFLSRYQTIAADQRLSFENQLVKKLWDAEKFNAFTLVDVISVFAEHLWDQFLPATKDELKNFYIYKAANVEIATNVATKFADKLLSTGMVTKEELISWLLGKLNTYAKAYTRLEDVEHFFFWSFINLHKYLEMDQEEFRKYFSASLKDLGY